MLSGACTSEITDTSFLRADCDSSDSRCLMEATTSLTVISFPEENVTPSRMVSVWVSPSSETTSSVASQGSTSPESVRRNSVSYTLPVNASVAPCPPLPEFDRFVGSYREPMSMVAAAFAWPPAL